MKEFGNSNSRNAFENDSVSTIMDAYDDVRLEMKTMGHNLVNIQ